MIGLFYVTLKHKLTSIFLISTRPISLLSIFLITLFVICIYRIYGNKKTPMRKMHYCRDGCELYCQIFRHCS